jgi:hypothetical protein
MRIWPHYKKNVTTIDELSLVEIDSMIEALQSLKVKGAHIKECYKEAIAKYNASGSTAVGPMGYFPSNEPILARATMEYDDHWASSVLTLQLSTKSANDLGGIIFDRRQLDLDIDAIWGDEDSATPSHRKVLSAILTSEEGQGDESTQYVEFGTWYPCGGVFVTKALGHCYICEHNIKGLSIKEVSETFYDAFVTEFSKKDEA